MANDKVLLELKITHRFSYVVHRSVLMDIDTNARIEGKIPVMLIEFGDGSEWVVMNRKDLSISSKGVIVHSE